MQISSMTASFGILSARVANRIANRDNVPDVNPDRNAAADFKPNADPAYDILLAPASMAEALRSQEIATIKNNPPQSMVGKLEIVSPTSSAPFDSPNSVGQTVVIGHNASGPVTRKVIPREEVFGLTDQEFEFFRKTTGYNLVGLEGGIMTYLDDNGNKPPEYVADALSNLQSEIGFWSRNGGLTDGSVSKMMENLSAGGFGDLVYSWIDRAFAWLDDKVSNSGSSSS